jgi:hypothetical protein
MTIRTIKVCDRCGAEQEGHPGRWELSYEVVNLHLPLDGGNKRGRGDLLFCHECRKELHSTLNEFMGNEDWPLVVSNK